MVTAYYMMKMAENKENTSFYEYYNALPNTTSPKLQDILSRCRICLKKGTVLIYENETSGICETLQRFADIKINVDDGLPKILCETCHKFIKAAILFRSVAKRSAEVLQKLVKENQSTIQDLTFKHSISDHDYVESSVPKISVKDKSKKHATNTALKTKKKDTTMKSIKVKCHICSKIMKYSYYKVHLTTHDPNNKQYVCDICGQSFSLYCTYHNHRQRHNDGFLFKCSFCPYRGKYKDLLKTHMRTHTGDYRYMCTECPKRFLFLTNLKSHMMRHKGPQFKCDSCKRAFYTKIKLQQHIQSMHLGIKNHVCNICGKAFGVKGNLRTHQRNIHKHEKLTTGKGRVANYILAKFNESNEQ